MRAHRLRLLWEFGLHSMDMHMLEAFVLRVLLLLLLRLQLLLLIY